MKNKILITGATGFIGLKLVKLLSKTANLYVLIRNVEKADRLLPKQVKKIKYDFKDSQLPVIPSHIDTVIHLAANIDYFGSYKKLARTNVLGTKRLLQVLPNSVSKFIYISTIEACQPKTNYGRTKLEAEKLVTSYATQKRINYTILRLGNVYGLENPFILLQLKKMMENKKNYLNKFYPYFKNIKVFPVFIDDVVLAIEKTLKQEIFGQFTLSGEKSYTIKEILKVIKQTLNLSWEEKESSLTSLLVCLIRGLYHRLSGKADFLDYLLNKAEENVIQKQKTLPFQYKVGLREGILQIFPSQMKKQR